MGCFIFFVYATAQLKPKEAENGVVLEKNVSVDHSTSTFAI